ncbi:MAG: hypothetical protein M3O02_03900 [Acidobacteriota bacterium]|nr:hypothetical protein [Acidobacteriota bacterium]
MTTRIMPGVYDYTGTRIATLDVGPMIRRNPEPSYTSECRQCGACGQSVSQRQLRENTARCRAGGCGKAAIKPTGRELLEEQKLIAAERQADAERAALEASAARMDAETEDYQRPTRYAPTPTKHVVMSERERREIREFREAEEAAAREADAPRLEAENKAATEQAKRERVEADRKAKQDAYWREAVETATDPKLFVSPELQNASMPKAKAESLNLASVNEFVAQTSDFKPYRTPHNADAILAYLDRNGVRIYDVATVKAAFIRLRDLGILQPAATPEPPKRSPAPPSRRAAETPQTYRGRDYLTGVEREFTQREVDRMSAAEFRKVFQVIDSVRDLFALMEETHA